ncbi:hypothetical protein GH714_016341 [Hevea brasiliensis]|uniref:DUF641 domain-containing protein n=1 Tax=Hevea brasiliensis TaxID=3981 RepID=A0A6A6KPH0_HEVBR|nr:hypothetical protein GH714_016341 [Hevea brasiliensis]
MRFSMDKAECEITLAESTVSFVREFELLVEIIIDGPIQFSRERIASAIPSQKTFRFQLEACDKAWCHYQRRFVTWKLKDAKLLEEDLVRAACQLEFSMMQSKLTLGDDETLSDDMEVIKKQVLDKQKLLKGKLQLLSGNAGLKHMERALTEMRSKFIGDKKSVSPFKSSTGQISSSCPPHSLEGSSLPISVGTSYLAKCCQQSSGNAIIDSSSEIADSSPELRLSLLIYYMWDGDANPQGAEIRNFRYGLSREDPRVCIGHFEKLSAPANDEEMKSSHHKLREELREISKVGVKSNASISFVVIKGLCQVLQEIQALKREISKARIRFVEPLIKGLAGLEYLKNAFANRYGPPTDALSSLTLTRQWLSSVHPIADQEWDEYIDSLSALTSNLGSSQALLPTTLRTGGTISVVSKIGSSATGSNKPECKGERVDKLVRLGLLKLVSGIGGLTPEALPETLKT